MCPASQEASEVMLVTVSLSISIDLTDVTLVSEDTKLRLHWSEDLWGFFCRGVSRSFGGLQACLPLPLYSTQTVGSTLTKVIVTTTSISSSMFVLHVFMDSIHGACKWCIHELAMIIMHVHIMHVYQSSIMKQGLRHVSYWLLKTYDMVAARRCGEWTTFRMYRYFCLIVHIYNVYYTYIEIDMYYKTDNSF